MRDESSFDPMIGQQIGQYEIVSLLGTGGMASVYCARQPTMHRNVALKIVSAQATTDKRYRLRFAQEVELAGKLEHVHIVPVYEQGTTEDNRPYLTMRLLRGGTLADVIKTFRPIPTPEIFRLMKPIVEVLDYIHERDILHRDLKPSNILLDERGNTYLADFGLAYQLRVGVDTLTETNDFLGTPAYISPEQAVSSDLTSASDVYSFAIILYEMLAGQTPFGSISPFQLIQAHLGIVPPLIHQFRPDLPLSINDIFSRALDKTPNKRYAKASELLSDLERTLPSKSTPEVANDTLVGIDTQQITKVTTSDKTKLSMVAATKGRSFRSWLPIAVGAIMVLLIAALLVIQQNKSGPLASTLNRPAKGTEADVIYTDAELRAAQAKMSSSFVGVMPCSLESGWHASYARSLTTKLRDLGFKVELRDSQKQSYRQPSIIDRFVAEGAKLIFYCAMDDAVLEDAIRAATKANVILVNFGDYVIGENGITLTISNEEMGRAVGEVAADYIRRHLQDNANIVVLDYPPVPITVVRGNAMEAEVRRQLPNIKIIGHFLGGTDEDGKASLIKVLAEHPEVNVILSINDNGSFGAADALRTANIPTDKVAIFSVDAEPEAVAMIKRGEYFVASFENDPVKMAELGVDGAIRLLAGYPVPFQIFLQGRVITRETLQNGEDQR